MKRWTDTLLLAFPVLLTMLAFGYVAAGGVAVLVSIGLALMEMKQRSDAARDAFLLSLARNTDAFLAAQGKKPPEASWPISTSYPSHTRILVKR